MKGLLIDFIGAVFLTSSIAIPFILHLYGISWVFSN